MEFDSNAEQGTTHPDAMAALQEAQLRMHDEMVVAGYLNSDITYNADDIDDLYNKFLIWKRDRDALQADGQPYGETVPVAVLPDIAHEPASGGEQVPPQGLTPVAVENAPEKKKLQGTPSRGLPVSSADKPASGKRGGITVMLAPDSWEHVAGIAKARMENGKSNSNAQFAIQCMDIAINADYFVLDGKRYTFATHDDGDTGFRKKLLKGGFFQEHETGLPLATELFQTKFK